LEGLSPGQYYWTVQSLDNQFAASGFAPEQSFNFNPTGNYDFFHNNDATEISIFPNPFSDQLNVKLSGGYNESLRVNLYNINGDFLSEFKSSSDNIDEQIFLWENDGQINNSIDNGVYIIEVLMDEKLKNRKYLKVLRKD